MRWSSDGWDVKLLWKVTDTHIELEVWWWDLLPVQEQRVFLIFGNEWASSWWLIYVLQTRDYTFPCSKVRYGDVSCVFAGGCAEGGRERLVIPSMLSSWSVATLCDCGTTDFYLIAWTFQDFEKSIAVCFDKCRGCSSHLSSPLKWYLTRHRLDG